MKKNIIKKEEIIKETQKLLSENLIVGVVTFTNVTSIELKEIRQDLKKKNIIIKVAKNTLVKKAFNDTDNKILIDKLVGQKLLVFGSDIRNLIQSLQIINKNNNNFKFNYFCLYGRVYSEQNYYELSNLGTKEDLIIKFIFICKSPIIKFINSLKYPCMQIILLFKIIESNIKGETNVYKK
jgi:large subunit ribosomal protein L10